MRRASTTTSGTVAARACWSARRTARRARSGCNAKPVPHVQQLVERRLTHRGRHLVQAEAGPLVKVSQALEPDALDPKLRTGTHREFEGCLGGSARQTVAGQDSLEASPGCDDRTPGISLGQDVLDGII